MGACSIAVCRLLAGSLAALFVGPAPVADPIAVLLQMRKVYANCRSYRDTGRVTTLGQIDGGSFSASAEFATFFERPDRFQFEFTGGRMDPDGGRSVFSFDGTRTLVLLPGNSELQVAPSLAEALDAAFGLTAGASLRVPGMLLPRVVGSPAPLVAPERLEDGTEDGRPCIRVRGKNRATPYQRTSGAVTVTVEDEAVTLWIDRETLLLRRVEEETTLSTYRARTVTTYVPELDVAIPAEVWVVPSSPSR